MIFRLDSRLIFPDPVLAEPDGLLAVGGDLSVERLLLAYDNSIFPWFNDDKLIHWYSPAERFVLFPEELRISKSMNQVLRSGQFEITTNNCFEQVIDACSTAPREGQEGTWITNKMKKAYIALHKQGFAQSFEIWRQNELVGGLYGVKVNKVFCGESMFSKMSNASKVALIYLCQIGDYKLIDCQLHTNHLESMGARMINRRKYLDYLKEVE